MSTPATFSAVRSYAIRFVGDSELRSSITITRRTAKSVWAIIRGEEKRCKIYHDHNGNEYVRPYGTYSMNPTARAQNVVEAYEDERMVDAATVDYILNGPTPDNGLEETRKAAIATVARVRMLNETQRPTGTVQLQGVGRVAAKPAQEFKVGERMGWNFGEWSQVVSIVKESASFVTFLLGAQNGRTYERRLGKTRLVAIV